MKLAWLCDIHLNFISAHALERLTSEVRAAEPDVVLIGGDIAEAHDILRYLETLDAGIQLPIYFVLGNHDYYRGTIPRVRREVTQLCARRERLHYLSRTSWVPLTFRVPAGVILHHADVPPEDRGRFGPVPTTNPRRSLNDCARDGFSPELLQQAAQQALRRGLVTRADLGAVDEALKPFGGLA